MLSVNLLSRVANCFGCEQMSSGGGANSKRKATAPAKSTASPDTKTDKKQAADTTKSNTAVTSGDTKSGAAAPKASASGGGGSSGSGSAATTTPTTAAAPKPNDTALPGTSSYPVVWISADREKEFSDVSAGTRSDARGSQVIWYGVDPTGNGPAGADAAAGVDGKAADALDPRIWNALETEECTTAHLKIESNRPDPVCPICHEHFAVAQSLKRIPHCRHLFHARCVRPWFARGNRTCPVCRHRLQVAGAPLLITNEPNFEI